ncbi:MAG: hypothetical protein HON76_11305, partial [Candidatus Scalindua sp.]|nr:hypothetical protein [Candidatus Scalindua sp.]
MLKRRRQNTKQKKLFRLGMLTNALLVIFLTGVVSFLIPSIARAISIDYGLGATLGLGTADLLETVINIVQWALGLLGLAAVIVIMYGGFIWMTAKGNQDKIAKAKKILFNGLIGLAIILLSWAIVFFVMRTIEDASSGPGGPGSCGAGPACVAPEICCGGASCELPGDCGTSLPTNLEITEVEVARDPSSDVYQCSKVKTRFNANIDGTTVEAAEAVDNLRTQDMTTGLPFNSPSGDDFVTVANTITYSHEDLFPINTDFEEWYPTTGTPIQDYDPRIISLCSEIGCVWNDPNFEWPFHVGTENDDIPPEITSTYPINTADVSYPDRNVSMAPVFTLNFNEFIDDTTIIDASSRPIGGNFVLEECAAGSDELNCNGPTLYDNGLLLANSIPNGVNIYIEDPAINPLKPFTWYQVTVQNVEDLCGNPMVLPEIWSFQTNDATPGVSSWYPTGVNECPGTDIYVTFGTTMYYNSVAIAISNVGSGGTDTRNAVLEPHTMGWPGSAIEHVVPGEGTFKIMDDPGVPPIDNAFRVFKYEPDASWASGTTYTVHIVTDMVINVDGDFLLHNWSFGVGDPETCTCSPFVSNLSPNQGPRESCMTVQGACFTGTPSNLADPTAITFDGVNGVIGGYAENYITTTLPAVYDDGDRPEAQVELTYVDPSYGVLYSPLPGPEFFVNSTAIADGPCLWSINPNAGYEGAGMSANGIRFGDPQGAGEIDYQGATGTATSWNDTDIVTSVPVGAMDGNVTVTDDGGQVSNGIYFDVLHVPPGTPYIVYNTSCSGRPSSPTPWIGREDVCRNMQLSVRFNEAMNPATFDMSAGGSILLQLCTDPGPNPCDTLDPALPGTYFYWPTYYILLADPTVPLLDQDAWYQATITTDVQSAGGINMASDYVWQFKTSDDPGACPVTDYLVVGSQLYTTPFEAGGANASPMGGVCQLIDPTDFSWNWLSQDPTIVAVTGWVDEISDLQAQNTEGNTIIEAWVDEAPTIPHGELPVEADFTYCEDDADCSSCATSVCIDAPFPHCSPVILDVIPITAPVGDFVTVEGCMFGGYAGSANLEFTGIPGWVDA